MKILNHELNKLHKLQPELFPQEIKDITDSCVETILQTILKNSYKWRIKEKLILRNTIENKNKDYVALKELTKKLIINKIQRKNKIKDKKELKELLKQLLMGNENKWFRTQHLIAELKKLPNNQFNNYELVPTRQMVYEIISELRRELEKQNYEKAI